MENNDEKSVFNTMELKVNAFSGITFCFLNIHIYTYIYIRGATIRRNTDIPRFICHDAMYGFSMCESRFKTIYLTWHTEPSVNQDTDIISGESQ